MARDYTAMTNSTERSFAKLAIENGWEITKRGWPDFFCVKDGEIICVEVKPISKDTGNLVPIKESQAAVMNALTDAGIRCFVSDGKRLIKYRKNQRTYK
jgi:hypothetical protein